jgi:hypothetical protein
LSAYDDNSLGHARAKPNVFVYADLPIAKTIDMALCCTLPDYHYRPGEQADFHRAVAISGLDAVLRERMDRVYDQVYASYAPGRGLPTTANWKPGLLAVLRDWVIAEQNLSTIQRAAALFAADRLVTVVEDVDAGELDQADSAFRGALETIGAPFSPIPEIGFPYTKGWLKQALEIAPDTEVGQMAVLTLISRGGCNRTGWNSETVIAESEKLLNKGVNPPTAIRLHFVLGDAYSDIVALAEGADPDIGDKAQAEYANEEEMARTKAFGALPCRVCCLTIPQKPRATPGFRLGI